MSDTDVKQDGKETADQRKEREAAEKEAASQAEQDAADVEVFWSAYRGEQLLRAQNNGSLDYVEAHAAHEAAKADDKDKNGKD